MENMFFAFLQGFLVTLVFIPVLLTLRSRYDRLFDRLTVENGSGPLVAISIVILLFMGLFFVAILWPFTLYRPDATVAKFIGLALAFIPFRNR